MSETFSFDVSYSTTFEKLEALRANMLEFVKIERRDYQPVFDVTVNGWFTDPLYLTSGQWSDLSFADFPDQEKMVLTADIKYKGNGQQGGALKGIQSHVQFNGDWLTPILSFTDLLARRRNKWICALKTALAEVKIYGPKGDPQEPSTTRYTRVPWELIEAQDREAAQTPSSPPDYSVPAGGWQLSDNNPVLREHFPAIFLRFTWP
jgi:hypothetical protein